MLDVIAAVIARGDRFLVCKRPLGKRHGGKWEFPGGKREGDETVFATIARELCEELGVKVAGVGRELFVRTDEDFRIRFTEVTIEGDPEPREHDEIKWATMNEIVALPLAPSDQDFVAIVFA